MPKWLADEQVSDNRVSAAHRTVLETLERIEEIVIGTIKFKKYRGETTCG